MSSPVSPDRPDCVGARSGLGTAAAVLWDIDGTLLVSGGVTIRAFVDAVEQVTGIRPDRDRVDFSGRIDPEIAGLLLATIGLDQSHVPAVLVRLAELARSRVNLLNEQVRPLGGVVDLLGELARAGVRQTVVTGNIESVAGLKLAAAGLIPPIDPKLGGYGDSGTTRVEVGRAALVRLFGPDWPAVAEDCWIIGDTPRDLACAQALGVRCALVATGRHALPTLTGLGADVVLAGLDQSAELAGLWGEL